MAAKPTWPPRAPAELADSGKRLWRSIVADADDQGQQRSTSSRRKCVAHEMQGS